MAEAFLQKSRHRTVYYFRRKIPLDLRERLGLTQIYRSLHTCDRKLAAIRARALATRTDLLFMKLRKPKQEDLLTIDYSIEIDFDEFRKPKRVLFTDVKPGEEQAVAAALNAVTGANGHRHHNPAGTGKTLREAIAAYKAALKHEVKPTSEKKYKPLVDHMGEFMGLDTPISQVTQELFARYAMAVKAETSKWSTDTIRSYITVAGLFWSWCKSHYNETPHITTAKLKPKKSTPANEEANAFALDQYRVIVSSLRPFRIREPHKYWLTILSMFTGARVEELCQLNINEDLGEESESGVHYLDIRESEEDPTKSVKTRAGWRRVPLHSALIASGFLSYVTSMRAMGHKTLFAAWPPYVDKGTNLVKHSHYASKWGGRHLAELRKRDEIKGKKLTFFKSMRHTFVNHLKQRLVEETIRAAIVGHEAGGINNNVYGKRYELRILSDVMEKHLGDFAALLR